MENSLNSCGVPLFSLFLFEKFLLFKPSSPSTSASHIAQPGSLPRILQQTLCPGRVFSHPGPRTGPRDLIVLKHSSYCLIFQCPLQSLVSNLHICWNTVGCSLCSSDQLGLSLVLRGTGLHSHLSRCHLPIPITSVLNSAFSRLLVSISFNFYFKFCSVFSFGTCFLVSLYWLPPYICFYVLDRSIMSLGLGRVALCNRRSVGPSGTVSLVTQVRCSSCVPCVGCVCLLL